MNFLDSQKGLIWGMFLFNTVILYNICSAWFLDIVISTCLGWKAQIKIDQECNDIAVSTKNWKLL